MDSFTAREAGEIYSINVFARGEAVSIKIRRKI